jgi:hypothetical protein
VEVIQRMISRRSCFARFGGNFVLFFIVTQLMLGYLMNRESKLRDSVVPTSAASKR